MTVSEIWVLICKCFIVLKQRKELVELPQDICQLPLHNSQHREHAEDLLREVQPQLLGFLGSRVLEWEVA